MDYINEIEKLFKFLELNLEFQEMKTMIAIKKEFNNDLNLFGCFIKDILTLENDGKISEDENLYSDFVLCFQEYLNKNAVNEFILKIARYSKYYLTIVFEETDNRVLLTTIATINSCSALQYYPFLMEVMDEYFNKNISRIHFMIMLQLITDMVVADYDKFNNSVDLSELRNKMKDILNSKIPERIAV